MYTLFGAVLLGIFGVERLRDDFDWDIGGERVSLTGGGVDFTRALRMKRFHSVTVDTLNETDAVYYFEENCS